MRSVTTLFLAVNYCCSIMSQHYCSDLTRELFTNSEMLTTLLNPSTAIASPHPHLSLNHEGRWGTTDDFTTSFFHFPLFPTALWDLANSRPVHSQTLSSHSSSVCLVFFPLSLCLALAVQCCSYLTYPGQLRTVSSSVDTYGTTVQSYTVLTV